MNNFKTTVRPIIKKLAKGGLKTLTWPVIHSWPHYSRLFLVGENSPWVIFWEMVELGTIAQKIGIRVANNYLLPFAENQTVFYGSHFSILSDGWLKKNQRVGMAYFHGKPGTGVKEFDMSYERLCQLHHLINRIQVSHTEMKEIVLSSGISPEKVFLIPIGINLSYFSFQTEESRRNARKKLGIPQSAAVIGSFQKDGVGWGDGIEPKMIKGPDILLKVIEILKDRIPELFVLLSGPARGYIKLGLEKIGVPYKHIYLKNYPEIGELFQAIDAYIVSSRQEGGPKAVLEAMASGVPLITTRVGQAMDLVRHGENGWMVDIDDVEGLAHWTEYAINNRSNINELLEEGLKTAQANSYEAQIPLWENFMKGFVNW